MKFKSKILGVILIALIAFQGVVNAAEINNDESLKLTLPQAIDYGLKNNMLIKLIDLDIDKEEVNYSEARNAYNDVENTNGSLKEIQIEKGYFKRVTEMSVNINEKTKEAKIKEIKIGIEESYFSVLNKKEDVKIKVLALQRAQKLLDIANSRLKLGLGTKQEVLSAEAGLEVSKLNLENAKDNLKYEKMKFNRLLGLELSKEVLLTDEIIFERYPDVDLDEKITFSLENRLDVFATKEQYEVSKLNFDIISDVYSSNTYIYKKAKFEEEKSYKEIINVEQDARLNVNKTYINLQKAQRTVEAMKKNVESLKEAYRLTMLSYESGIKTITDVLGMQVKLEEVELSYNKALLQHQLAKISFEASYSIGF